MPHGSVAASNAGTVSGVNENKQISPAKQISNIALYGKTHPSAEDIKRHKDFLRIMRRK